MELLVCRYHFRRYRRPGQRRCFEPQHQQSGQFTGYCRAHWQERFLARHARRRRQGRCVRCVLCRAIRMFMRRDKRRQRSRVRKRQRVEASFDRKYESWYGRPPPRALAGLEGRRRSFVEEYAENGGNASAAARAAGYAKESTARGGSAARVRGHRLLQDPVIRQAIREAGAIRAEWKEQQARDQARRVEWDDYQALLADWRNSAAACSRSDFARLADLVWPPQSVKTIRKRLREWVKTRGDDWVEGERCPLWARLLPVVTHQQHGVSWRSRQPWEWLERLDWIQGGAGRAANRLRMGKRIRWREKHWP